MQSAHTRMRAHTSRASICALVRSKALLCVHVRISFGSLRLLPGPNLSQFPPSLFASVSFVGAICNSHVSSVSCDVMCCVTCAAAPSASALPHTALMCTCCHAFHPMKPCHVAGGPLYTSPHLKKYANAGGACLLSPSLGSRAEMCKPSLVIEHSPFSIPWVENCYLASKWLVLQFLRCRQFQGPNPIIFAPRHSR